MPLGVFIFLAALAVISALGMVLQRNPVHCLLALVVTLLTIAVLFIGLDAVTVGFLQTIVYVGAIMVLFLFVIWLLNLQAELRSATGLSRAQGDRWAAERGAGGRAVRAPVACAQRGRRPGGRAGGLWIDRDVSPRRSFPITWSRSR